MTFRELDTVILKHELPAHGLRAGDIGAVVGVYPDGLQVELSRRPERLWDSSR